MPDQTSSNILVAIKRETSTGVAPATVTGASQMRIIDSPGLTLRRAQIRSQEKRVDGNVNMGRLGFKSVDGSYNAEFTVGDPTDLLLEALVRSTWAAAVTISEVEMTSITIANQNQIIAAGGSWISEGVRVGDLVRLTDHQTAANNNINLRASAVTASTLTVFGTPLTNDASADSDFDLTILKKVVNNTAGPTRYSHAIEQYDQDIDLSELFLGCRIVGARMSFRPGQMATVQYTFLGMDRTQLETGTSPFYDTPALTTGLALVADDSAIYYNGSVVTNFHRVRPGLQHHGVGRAGDRGAGEPRHLRQRSVGRGTITGIRQDFSNLTLFDAETEFAAGITLAASGAAPVDTIGIWLPRVKIAGLSAPVGGGDGAKIETLELFTGPAAATSTVDATIAQFQSSAA